MSDEAQKLTLRWMFIENIVTICATAAVVLGGLALGGGGWSFLGLLLMLNINYRKRARDASQPTKGDE